MSDSKSTEWYWQDFNRIEGKSRMDGRRAAFLVYDFINMFNIEDFKVLSSDGEWQMKTIEIVYRTQQDPEEIENKWYKYLEGWKDKH